MCERGETKPVQLCLPSLINGSMKAPVDSCIAGLVQLFNDKGIRTTCVCCGHDTDKGISIVWEDGLRTHVLFISEYQVWTQEELARFLPSSHFWEGSLPWQYRSNRPWFI